MKRAVAARGISKKTCEYIREFPEPEETYGVTVYNILSRVEMYDADTYTSWVNKMEELGAKRFLAYNTNHIISTLPEFHIVSHLGNEFGADVTLQKYYRSGIKPLMPTRTPKRRSWRSNMPPTF